MTREHAGGYIVNTVMLSLTGVCALLTVADSLLILGYLV